MIQVRKRREMESKIRKIRERTNELRLERNYYRSLGVTLDGGRFGPRERSVEVKISRLSSAIERLEKRKMRTEDELVQRRALSLLKSSRFPILKR